MPASWLLRLLPLGSDPLTGSVFVCSCVYSHVGSSSAPSREISLPTDILQQGVASPTTDLWVEGLLFGILLGLLDYTPQAAAKIYRPTQAPHSFPKRPLGHKSLQKKLEPQV